MVNFEKKTWQNRPDRSTPIRAEELNRIEEAVDEAISLLNTLDTNVNLLYHGSIDYGSIDMCTESGMYIITRMQLVPIVMDRIYSYGVLFVSKNRYNSSTFGVQQILVFDETITKRSRDQNNIWSSWSQDLFNINSLHADDENVHILGDNKKLFDELANRVVYVGDQIFSAGSFVDYTNNIVSIYEDGTGDYILNTTPDGRVFIYTF